MVWFNGTRKYAFVRRFRDATWEFGWGFAEEVIGGISNSSKPGFDSKLEKCSTRI